MVCWQTCVCLALHLSDDLGRILTFAAKYSHSTLQYPTVWVPPGPGPRDDQPLAVGAPVNLDIRPLFVLRQHLVLLGLMDLSFRRHLHDHLDSLLSCFARNSLDDLPPGVISPEFDLFEVLIDLTIYSP